MYEVRSHRPSPVQSEGLEAPLSVPPQVEAREDIDATLEKWDFHIKKTARAVAMSIGASGDDAEEFAQAARIALWRAIRKGAPTNDAYRKGIIKNAMISAVRNERKGFGSMWIRREALVEGSGRRPDEDDVVARVDDWAATLPNNLRNIYESLYVHGYTQREVARRLHITSRASPNFMPD